MYALFFKVRAKCLYFFRKTMFLFENADTSVTVTRCMASASIRIRDYDYPHRLGQLTIRYRSRYRYCFLVQRYNIEIAVNE